MAHTNIICLTGRKKETRCSGQYQIPVAVYSPLKSQVTSQNVAVYCRHWMCWTNRVLICTTLNQADLTFSRALYGILLYFFLILLTVIYQCPPQAVVTAKF